MGFEDVDGFEEIGSRDSEDGFDEVVDDVLSVEEAGTDESEATEESTAEDMGPANAGAEEEPSSDSAQETRLIVNSNAKSRDAVFFIASIP